MADVDSIKSLLNDVITKRGIKHQTIEINPINSGGANYTSNLYAVTVIGDKDLKLFVKVAAIGEKLRELMRARTLYSTEQLVYTNLVPAFNDLEIKNGLKDDERYVFPEFFGCNPNIGEETVILEDLLQKGYHVYSRFDSVDWLYSSTAVRSLAKFHALSFAYQKENPEEFDVIAEKLKFVDDYDREDKNLDEVWKKMIASSLNVIKDDNNREKLMAFLTRNECFTEYGKFKKPLNVTVLAHGDYRTSNLLFKKDQDGVIQTIAVDYQTVHSGCPVTDLLYFIVLGTDEDFRREHYQQLLDYYHEELGAALQKLKVDVNEVYPREVFEAEVKEMLPPALCMAVAILPVVTVEAENAPQVAGDADVTQFALTPNELFARRLNGIVTDFVQWGVI